MGCWHTCFVGSFGAKHETMKITAIPLAGLLFGLIYSGPIAGQSVGIGTTTPSAQLSLGTLNAGFPGDSIQLLLSGQNNVGANGGSTSGTFKLKIEGYNNDYQHVYPVHISDENNNVDFFLRNRFGPADPVMYFAGRTGIGTTNPLTRLHVMGSLTVEDGQEDDGRILVSDAAGTGIWTSDLDVGAFRTDTSGVLSNAGTTYEATDFLFGAPTLDYDGNSSHAAKMFFDKSKAAFRAGQVTTTYWDEGSLGQRSIALGNNPTASSTDAIALGTLADASAEASVAVGYHAQATGVFSHAIGEETLASGYRSIAVGSNAEATNTQSVAIGAATASAGGSVAMGNANASGPQSVAIGHNTAASATNAIAIGVNATASGPSAIAIGDNGTASGSNAVALQGAQAQGSYSLAAGIGTISKGYGAMAIGWYNDPLVSCVETAPNSGCPGLTPLFIVGKGSGPGARSNALVLYSNGALVLASSNVTKPGGGTWSGISDRRLKQNIRTFDPGLDDIVQIRPIEYQYNALSGHDTSTVHIGVVAQELQEIAPYMVDKYWKEGVEYLSVDNSAMTYMLINAVTELAEQNADLNVANTSIQEENGRIRAQLEELLARVEALEGRRPER